jgi:hypothetical protein
MGYIQNALNDTNTEVQTNAAMALGMLMGRI